MAGRPLKYDSVKDMEKAIDEYFAKTEIITITGLALYLGFNSIFLFYTSVS